MDTALSALLSWQLILFSLGIFFIVWFIRTIVELAWKASVQSSIWNEIVLRFLPCIVGGVIGYFAINYPYPLGVSVESGRIFFGVVAGGISGMLYAALKGMARNYIQGALGGVIQQPAPPPPSNNTGMMGGNNAPPQQ